MSGSADVDYSDFEYQQIEAQFSITGDGSNDAATVDGLARYDVLEAVGGLDNNEVAELVGYRLQVGLEVEDSAEDGDQDVGSSIEFRGTFGANLDGTTDAISSNELGERNIETVFFNSTGGTNANISGTSVARDEIFDHYRVTGTFPFDDQTNGPGGGGSLPTLQLEENYRQTHGRGPVLDSNDDIGVLGFVIAADTVLTTAGFVRGTLIWDVAETDDSGRAFSVPEGM